MRRAACLSGTQMDANGHVRRSCATGMFISKHRWLRLRTPSEDSGRYLPGEHSDKHLIDIAFWAHATSQVLSAHIVKDSETGRPRGSAFVEFADASSAQNAVKAAGTLTDVRELLLRACGFLPPSETVLGWLYIPCKTIAFPRNSAQAYAVCHREQSNTYT
jgi:RNA recognition motif-containing protein